MSKPASLGQSNGALTAAAGAKRSPLKISESEALATVDRAAKRSTTGRGTRRADVTEITYRRLGLRIFVALLVLIGAMLLCLALFAALTYPHTSDVRALLGPTNTGANALKDWEGLRAAWIGQVTQLGQFLIFGSVLPLLATVVGYLLGERRSTA
jgi:hypothetical protein